MSRRAAAERDPAQRLGLAAGSPRPRARDVRPLVSGSITSISLPPSGPRRTRSESGPASSSRTSGSVAGVPASRRAARAATSSASRPRGSAEPPAEQPAAGRGRHVDAAVVVDHDHRRSHPLEPGLQRGDRRLAGGRQLGVAVGLDQVRAGGAEARHLAVGEVAAGAGEGEADHHRRPRRQGQRAPVLGVDLP